MGNTRKFIKRLYQILLKTDIPLNNNRKRKQILITMESIYEAMEFFRFGPNANTRKIKHGKAVLAIFVIASILLPSHVESMPAPQVNNFNRFLPQAPALQNQGSLGTQAAVIGSALPLGFIAFNVLRGDTDLSVAPNVALNVDPNTGALRPAVTANVQVGNDNVVNPTFNVGGQLDTSGNGAFGLPVAPVVGTGINIGDQSTGQPTGDVGSNFALSNGQANAQFGGGLGLGAFNLGNIFGR